MAKSSSGSLTVGLVMIAIGAVLTVTRLAPVQAAPAWLIGLGAVFAVLAIVQRRYGPLVAGMVLLGLGGGMILGDSGALGLSIRAWRFVALGLGFLGIYVLAVVLQLKRHPWPLVVGAILVAIGAAPFLRGLLFIPPDVEIFVRTWWPAGLVIVGLLLVAKSVLRK